MDTQHTNNNNESTPATSPSTSNELTPQIPHKRSSANGKGRKRPYPSKRTLNEGKRSKASFDKKEVGKHVASTTLIYTSYDIETSFHGIRTLCETLYAILVNRDQKLSNLLTANHLIYVTLLSSIYRCLSVSSKSTTTVIRNLSYLKEAVHDLLLPDILCQYVETIGYIKLSTGATVIPFIRSYLSMKNCLDFVDPCSILAIMGRPECDNDWSIDDEVILQYKRAISRFLKNAVQLRLVNFSEQEAKPEFLAVYHTLPGGRIQPEAFEQMNATQCTLGAVYQFRNSRESDNWNGLVPPVLHEATAVHLVTYVTDYILHHLKGDESFKQR